MMIFPDLECKPGDHIHCNRFGMPKDMKTGETLVCSEYLKAHAKYGGKPIVVCSACGKPMILTEEVGWVCKDLRKKCNSNLSQPVCDNCDVPIAVHTTKDSEGCIQCPHFSPALAA